MEQDNVKKGYHIKKCEKCSKEFKPTSSTQRWCSNECKNTSSKFICEVCQKEFEKWIKSPHKVCSQECRNKLIAIKKGRKAERVILNCYVCKKEFEKRKSQIKSEFQFCSKTCWSVWMRDERPNIIIKQSKTIKNQIKDGRKMFNQNFERGYLLSEKNKASLFYKSSWEKIMYEKLEKDENVIIYIPEPFPIRYTNEDSMSKDYYPDILIIYKDKRELVEIKPKSLLSWKINKIKIKAAKQYCVKHGLIFRIITEDDLFEKT